MNDDSIILHGLPRTGTTLAYTYLRRAGAEVHHGYKHLPPQEPERGRLVVVTRHPLAWTRSVQAWAHPGQDSSVQELSAWLWWFAAYHAHTIRTNALIVHLEDLAEGGPALLESLEPGCADLEAKKHAASPLPGEAAKPWKPRDPWRGTHHDHITGYLNREPWRSLLHDLGYE